MKSEKNKVVKAVKSLRVDPALWEELEKLAEAESRSTNNLVEIILREYLAKVNKKSK